MPAPDLLAPGSTRPGELNALRAPALRVIPYPGPADAYRLFLGRGVAHSGRVIFAAAVMVAVFFTFALSGPLPLKEMGIILGVAVLLDAALIRLLLLPVLLWLVGRWAWYLLRWAQPGCCPGSPSVTPKGWLVMIFCQIAHDDLGCASWSAHYGGPRCGDPGDGHAGLLHDRLRAGSHDLLA